MVDAMLEMSRSNARNIQHHLSCLLARYPNLKRVDRGFLKVETLATDCSIRHQPYLYHQLFETMTKSLYNPLIEVQ